MFGRNALKFSSLLLVFVMVLTACAPAATPAPTVAPTAAAPVVPTATTAAAEPTAAPTATTAAAEPTAAATETTAATAAATSAAPATGEIKGPAGGFLEKALAGEYKGKTVTVDGTQTDPDDKKMAEGWKAFEDATGIVIKYVGNKEFEARISINVDAGNAPDIADFPQPALVARFASQGKLTDLSSFIPKEWLTQQYDQSWLDMANIPGADGKPITAGVWNRYSVKSLVWYPKAKFDEAGYKVPTTWDELIALSDQIKKDGDTPWCIGIESQAATGWPATDWMEDIMLRTTSPENYDKWVKGELKFSSPEVKKAAETMGKIWFTDGYVYGGRQAISSTYFGDAPAPMFQDPPKCWLHRQANFIVSFFPETAKPGVDYDFFYFPPIDPQYGKPFLVAGDQYVMFNDKPEARALIEYFTLPQSVSGFMQQGGALAAQKTATSAMYKEGLLEKSIADLVASTATTYRFDGSDIMPGEVGSGSFWKGMTDYASGAADLDTVLKEIDASWPKK